jgi:hypothetical protein
MILEITNFKQLRMLLSILLLAFKRCILLFRVGAAKFVPRVVHRVLVPWLALTGIAKYSFMWSLHQNIFFKRPVENYKNLFIIFTYIISLKKIELWFINLCPRLSCHSH